MPARPRMVTTLGAMSSNPAAWVKAFHIVFVASWFAGLFYLPRIFVNLAMVPAGSEAERERLLLMARKLLRFTTLLSVPAIVLGLWLWLGYGFRICRVRCLGEGVGREGVDSQSLL